MVNTRRTSSDLPPTTHVVASITDPPPTTAEGSQLQLETSPPLENPQIQGMAPQTQEANLPSVNPLQVVIAPLGATNPQGLQISTTVLPPGPNPPLGMLTEYGMGGSRYVSQPHERYVPSYMQGLETHVARRQDFSGPYTKDDESSTDQDEDIAPRRRHLGKEVAVEGTRSQRGPQSVKRRSELMK